MIEIIKHGTKQKTTCKKCGCVFSFEDTDLKPQIDPIKRAIDCPQCRNEIVLFNVRGSKTYERHGI